MTKETAVPSEAQAAYQAYNKEERRRLFKIVFWFAFFGMPAGISLDMQVYPGHVPYFLKLRLLSSVLVTLLFWIYYRSWAARFDRALFILLLMVPQGIITWMIYASEGPLSPYYAGLNVVLVAFCMLLPWTYQETLVFSVITFFLYVVACVAHGGVTFGGVFFNNTYFLFLTATFAVIGSYFTNRLRVREFTTRYELDNSRKQLEENNRKLRELDQAKTRFFANISHELRTPLTLLISPLESLRKRKAALLDEETRDILGLMESNAMRLLKLINDLLDLVKMESGKVQLKKVPLEVESFVKGLVQAVQPAALDKRVLLSSRVDPGLGWVLADRDKLEKILLNLLFNSVKFTPAGGKVELQGNWESGDLVLKVTDTGMGISEKDLPHIFDRFFQADSSAQRKYQGTGIGLALVKELTEAQGGMVSAESRPGEGTSMTVRIPAEKASAGVVADASSPAAVSSPGEAEWLEKLYRRAEAFPAMTSLAATLRPEGTLTSGKPKLLVADDEPDMLRFLVSQLKERFEVLEAVDGDQAVEKAKQFIPEIILLDMMMPGKDGITACREIKTHLPTRSVPVVLLTARADDATKVEALEAGASDFLAKPFSVTELHVRVRNLVDSHSFQRDLARQKVVLESAMERLKDTETQLVQSEKMASLGRLSAGIIHEINNPLNYATTALHLLKGKSDQLPPEERPKYAETVADIEEGVGRVARIVSDLRTFTRPTAGVPDSVALEEIVTTSLRFLGGEWKDRVDFHMLGVEGLRVWADCNDLIHVLVNLFQNSLDALQEKSFEGEKPSLALEASREDGKVLVRVRDNGPGITPEHLDKVFDPFFTTKEVGRGMGLGLSICYKLLERQGGGISVRSEKGKFAEFVLEIPAERPPGPQGKGLEQ